MAPASATLGEGRTLIGDRYHNGSFGITIHYFELFWQVGSKLMCALGIVVVRISNQFGEISAGPH